MVWFYQETYIEGSWQQIGYSLRDELQISHPRALILLALYNWDEERLRHDWQNRGYQLLGDRGIRDNNTIVDCFLCKMEDNSGNGMGTLFCGHACLLHLQGLLSSKIRDGATRLACYVVGCDTQFPYTILPADMIPDYMSNLKFGYALARKYKPCPSSTCSCFYLPDSTDSYREKMITTCPCGFTFCSMCALGVHFPAFCENLKLWNSRVRPETVNNPCPGCGQLYYRDSGCSLMTCRNASCQTLFCWDCLALWSPFHSCGGVEVDELDAQHARCAAEHQQLDIVSQQLESFREKFSNHTWYGFLASIDRMLEVVSFRKYLSILCSYNPMSDQLLSVEKEAMENAFERVMRFISCDVAQFDMDGYILRGKMEELRLEQSFLIYLWEDLYGAGTE